MSKLVRISDESHKVLRDLAFTKCVSMSYLIDLSVRNLGEADIISISEPVGKSVSDITIDDFVDRLGTIRSKYSEELLTDKNFNE